MQSIRAVRASLILPVCLSPLFTFDRRSKGAHSGLQFVVCRGQSNESPQQLSYSQDGASLLGQFKMQTVLILWYFDVLVASSEFSLRLV